MPQDPNCIFCKIATGQIPARVIMQNDRATAFLDAFPLAAGHTLVVPKAHFQKVQDMDAPDAQAVFDLVYKITARVESAAGTGASTIAIHNGKEAGQEVSHVHIHIIPRKPGDGAGPVHSMFKNRPKLSAQEMDALLDKMNPAK
ncbi:HIT family hydrolase, diadenosine tetraphosphate hydrolase [Candidatus Nitrososphaera evergladensis SR1]|jgi:histidine triad (HIT) family protein|uniref:HIT family hydrolase, diadenosine tetraphosphate hydrolase n=1 Tax=Candidatus Nitrososphaera evergladensis SR1 TaxID=1459636 RepID=A0A075MU79_9ARCH|nr:HIT family protein [Candidatus Nitrososphaera evergladensis]AIF84703.1 HIT family hydrolase, diadenosine tetraphosphate hydrolase [Candidatus Nitrososphaera evergladensis SR1]